MDIDTELADLIEKTFSGDPKDYRNLAYEYYKKDENSTLAQQWFQRAAEKNDSESHAMLGIIYADANDNLKAEEHLIAAYNGGFIRSLWRMALLMDSGYKITDTSFAFKTAEECCIELLQNEHATEHFQNRARQYIGSLAPPTEKPFISQNNKTEKATPATPGTPAIFQQHKDNNITPSKSDTAVDPRIYLDRLIGLQPIKNQIKQIENVVAFNSRRNDAGLRTPKQSHHFVFIGNPGTGKTEVARLLGQIYKDIGILKSGHVVEVDRLDLIAGKVGQTAPKTMEAVSRAMDGILFIDEAHMLWDGHESDFGLESISALVKAMEDYRENLIVIFAGYTVAMDRLIYSNMGLKSRIRHHMHFSDYNTDELVDIYIKFAEDSDFTLHNDTKKAVQKLMKSARKYLNKDFGNGRFVRNCFDQTIEKMASRTVLQGNMDKEDLATIMFMDIPTFEEMQNASTNKKTPNNNVIKMKD